MQFEKILVIGLGQLGLPAAKYVKEKGFEVYGFDASLEAVNRAESIGGIERAHDFRDYDAYIICISTHSPDDMFSPQTEGILSIADRISKEAKRDGALVSIESTIPRGTSQKVFEILRHRLHVVHAPHRWYALEEKEHGVNQLRVIGGVCDCCLGVGMQFYDKETIEDNNNHNYSNNNTFSTIHTNSATLEPSLNTKMVTYKKSLEIPMHPVSRIVIAETTKIVENAHRYLQIAFAEELYLYSQANNISFPELRDALNTKWNVNILEPREGIGGHCLPKDTRMFLESSNSIRSRILTAAMEVDHNYRAFRAGLNHRLHVEEDHND
ncbi:NAD(P)-binding domain-containing protein [Nitrososphaera sp. AFS]|uniref:NAD(P)-binding domain-containing protein n=1 Tax=Nitrososphaera sp. AFS TaxID=2301191 RepID=UPI001917270E|nr:NAD(P)-binding domain-containing protein [Nitrososphaera sp. AFS]NAL77464.1 potassium transporter TrkA [Nitrososphaera sp. AFS]